MAMLASMFAQASATAEFGSLLPIVVAQPPRAMNDPCMKDVVFFNSSVFAAKFVLVRNLSTQIGANAETSAASARVRAMSKAERAVIHDLHAERWGHLAAGWPVDRLALLRSHLGPDGAGYETLHEATLYAQEQVSRDTG